MPRYSYGNDPADFYQNSGFDPYTGRLNGGALVMQVLNQIAGLKEKKKQDQWDLEDRELKKRLVEAQISNYGETTGNRPSELEQKIDLLMKNPELYDRMFPKAAGQKTLQQIEDEARARAKGTASVSGTKADDDTRKDAVDARRSFLAEAKERRKRYDDLMNQQGAIAKQINSTKLLLAKARGSGDPITEATLNQTLTQLQLQHDIISSSLDTMANEFNKPAVAEQATKTIGGVTYYKWSDGKWRDSKESTATKK